MRRLILALINRLAAIGDAALTAAFPSEPNDWPVLNERDETWGPATDEPTSYDDAYNEAVQRAADERENCWIVGDLAVWEIEYQRRGENA